MFRANQPCLIQKFSGTTNIYGEPVVKSPVAASCAILKLVIAAQKTSVRTDSSASRANAEEIVAMSGFLFPHDTDVEVNDRLIIRGHVLRITSKHERFAVTGRFDHIQCEAEYIGEYDG